MQFWSAVPLPSFLLLCAAVLMLMHARTWRSQQRQEMEPDEEEYHRRQFRRRMQSSAMLGLVAVGIFVGQLIADVARPAIAIAFWGLVGLVVVWLAVLAMADIVATRYFYGRLRQENLVEQAKLKAQLRRIQSARSNGKSSASRLTQNRREWEP